MKILLAAILAVLSISAHAGGGGLLFGGGSGAGGGGSSWNGGTVTGQTTFTNPNPTIFTYNITAGSACFGSSANGTISTFTATGELDLAKGAAIVGSSSVTASAFFGDGSHLSNVGGGLSGGVATVYPKWTSSSAIGNSFTNEVSSGVTISSHVAILGNLLIGGGSLSGGNNFQINGSGGISSQIQSSGNSPIEYSLTNSFGSGIFCIESQGFGGSCGVTGTSAASTVLSGWSQLNLAANSTVVATLSGTSMGVGTVTPGSRFQVVGGSITANGSGAKIGTTGELDQGLVTSCSTGLTSTSTGAITGCVASDVSLKKNIKPLEYVPGSIDFLHPVSYSWKDPSRGIGEKQGFIAQQVEQVYPRAVVGAGPNLKGIDSNAVIAELVLEVQSLRRRMAELETKK